MTYITLCILPILWFLVNGNVTTYHHYQHFPTKCGKTRFSSRIINGQIAELGQYPWMVRIGLIRRRDIFFYCAGALVNRYYVATAAHCKNRQGNMVRVGENYLNTDRDCSKGVCAPPHQDIMIRKLTYHERYCPSSLINDFALIELVTPVTYNDFVQPICFPRRKFSSDDLERNPLTVAGWGLIKYKPEKWPQQLRYMVAPLKSKTTCGITYFTTLEDSQLCMGYILGQDACRGDSGGPAFQVMKTQSGELRTYLRGIISYGLLVCGLAPSVYTDVTHFADWARRVIKKS